MSRYLDTAIRYRWIIVIVLALTWGAGAAVAYTEYMTSFEADATVWTDRQSLRFTTSSPQDPGLASFVSPATDQAGVLSQLLQTRSFLQDVVQRASLQQPAGSDERAFFQEISKRFRVDVLGTNLLRLSYRASDPRTGSQMVLAALSLRAERLSSTRSAATAAAATYYRSELAIAQRRQSDAQRPLDEFDRTHKPPLSLADEYQQRQLRADLEEAKGRVDDLRARIEGSTALPIVLELADTLDFQVIDKPIDDAKPSGGSRPAATIAGSAAVAGLALVGLLLLVGTLVAGDIGQEIAAGSTREPESDTPGPIVPSASPNTPVIDPNVASSSHVPNVATRPNTLAT